MFESPLNHQCTPTSTRTPNHSNQSLPQLTKQGSVQVGRQTHMVCKGVSVSGVCWRQQNLLLQCWSGVSQSIQIRFDPQQGTMQPRRRKQSEIIEILFSNRKIDELNDYLEQHQDLDLISLVDTQSNTVLHQLAFEGHLDIIRLFVNKAKKYLLRKPNSKNKMFQRDQNQEITAWMNMQNSEGFTPLLYATYNGHMDIIKYLVEDYRVNEKLTTKTGLNPLHLAAQKNMVLPFIYFKRTIDINESDQNQSTSLHWASYMNSEEVVGYLLAAPELSTLDERDHEGNTPLMMAVSYGNTRVVRRLLIKGANRYVRNNANLLPLQIAKENEYKTIAKMLDEKYTCLDLVKFYCNVKVEYKPKERKCTIPIIFLLAFLTNLTVLNILIQFTEFYSDTAEGILFGILILLYFSLLKGPTTLNRERQDLTELLISGSEKPAKGYCFECAMPVPKRGYHCEICRVCIRQYDHHCTWINNCVGKRNIGRFIAFLFFLILCLGFLGLISFLAEVSIFIEKPELYKIWFTFRMTQDTTFKRVATICLLAVNFLSSLFIFPVLALFGVQIKNLLKNKTTYESYRSPPQSPNEIKERIRKYDSRVSLRNCKMMCSDNNSSFTTSRSSKSRSQGLEHS